MLFGTGGVQYKIFESNSFNQSKDFLRKIDIE